MKDYHINIFYSDNDGGYIADIPDLPACSGFGRTTSIDSPSTRMNGRIQIVKKGISFGTVLAIAISWSAPR